MITARYADNELVLKAPDSLDYQRGHNQCLCMNYFNYAVSSQRHCRFFTSYVKCIASERKTRRVREDKIPPYLWTLLFQEALFTPTS